MSLRDEIKRKLEALDGERIKLEKELKRAEHAELYRDYLRALVDADIAEPLSKDVDSAFKDEVLRWLAPQESKNREPTIKAWVIAIIGEFPDELTPADLRDRFKREFGPKRVASLRQYLAKPFGLVQQGRDGKLVLARKGQVEFRKLRKTKRG